MSMTSSNEFTGSPEPTAFAQAAPDAPPPPPERVRRVGTLTLGVALIVTGILVLFALFQKDFFAINALRFSPLLLVLLGIEVIVNAVVWKGQKLKYDLLSMFVCFLLITGTLCAAAIPAIYRNWGAPRSIMEQSMRLSLDTLCAEKLAGTPGVLNVDTEVYLSRMDLQFTENATYENLSASDYVRITVRLAGPYADEKAFAASCRTVLDSLSTVPVRTRSVRLYHELENSDVYELYVDSPYLWKLDAEGLAKLVTNDDYERREREQHYAELQQERETLSSERQELYAQLEQEREALSSEREELYAQLEQERAQMSSEAQQEREALSSERETLYADLERQRNEVAATQQS